MVFILPMMIAICGLIIPVFPSCTVAMTVWIILALSVPIMGPPGFLPKLIVGIGVGFAGDILFMFLRRKDKLTSVLGGLLVDIVGIALAGLIFYFFLPQELAMKFIQLIPVAFVLAVILGPLGGLTGWKIFDKIRDRAIVARLRGE